LVLFHRSDERHLGNLAAFDGRAQGEDLVLHRADERLRPPGFFDRTGNAPDLEGEVCSQAVEIRVGLRQRPVLCPLVELLRLLEQATSGVEYVLVLRSP
jgi:hypothetical protein